MNSNTGNRDFFFTAISLFIKINSSQSSKSIRILFFII